MVGKSFAGPKGVKMSKELSIIFEGSCPGCFRFFDEEERAPYVITTCQHVYCKKCVNTVILKNAYQGECDDCKELVIKQFIIPSRLRRKMMQIERNYAKEQPETRQLIIELEKNVANDLQNAQQCFFQCPECKETFNNTNRRPMGICQNEHVICSQCLNQQNGNMCRYCKVQLLDKPFVYQLIINTSQFISKVLFKQSVKFVVGEHQYSIRADANITIKDIFQHLQDFGHITKRLDIKNCIFHAECRKQIEKQEVHFSEKIGVKIKKIYMQFDQLVLKKGSSFTQPSKRGNQLNIKISSFNVNKVRDSSIFGPILENEPSSLTNSKVSYLQKIMKEQKKGQKQQQESLSLLQVRLQSTSILRSKIKEKSELQMKKKKSSIVQSRIQMIKKMPIGTQISSEFIQELNTSLEKAKRIQVFRRFLDKHELKEEDRAYLCYSTYKIINQPFTQADKKQSKKLELKYQLQAQNGNYLYMILKVLYQQLQDGQIQVLFTPKSNERSQFTLKALTSAYLTDRFIVVEKIDEDENFYFERMYNEKDILASFVAKQKQKYSARFGISKESIVIHNLIKGNGSNELVLSTNEGHIFSKHVRYNVDKEISIHPYFTKLEISQDDFTAEGAYNFKSQRSSILYRGNWPYYQPINCFKYGIKVAGMFDNGDNTWLGMKDRPGEWAVGFHGLRNPNQAFKHYKKVIENTLANMYPSLEQQSLIVVQNSKQAFQDSMCVNVPRKVGTGVYFSPFFAEALPFTSPQMVGQKHYHMVFQCRLNPEQIMIPRQKQDYWIVSESAAIRPYGIILIEAEQRDVYPSPKQQFGDKFKYQKFKSRIQASSKKK